MASQKYGRESSLLLFLMQWKPKGFEHLATKVSGSQVGGRLNMYIGNNDIRVIRRFNKSSLVVEKLLSVERKHTQLLRTLILEEGNPGKQARRK